MSLCPVSLHSPVPLFSLSHRSEQTPFTQLMLLIRLFRLLLIQRLCMTLKKNLLIALAFFQSLDAEKSHSKQATEVDLCNTSHSS
jgi:hypothetical protein